MMVDFRLGLAIAAGKASALSIRRLGRGGGTALPGVVSNQVDRDILDKLAARVPGGCIVVAGTNGKTTSSRILAEILERSGLGVIHNRSGSNLVRGITAAFTEQVSLSGQPAGQIAVIETDEAALPEIVQRTRPRLIVLLNLFRDQLDRYGELDSIARSWQETLNKLDPSQTVLINADDPSLAAISEDTPARRLTFGFQQCEHTLDHLPHAADAAVCRRCGASLTYDELYLSHLGAYRCEQCGYQRPDLDYGATDIQLNGLDSGGLNLSHGDEQIALDASLPGLYNLYNVAGAAASALTLGMPGWVVQAGVGEFKAAFGRIERVEVENRHLVLVLIKNPTGFNEVLRTIAMSDMTDPVLIIINDLDADGRDVSWLWDVDAEHLADVEAPLYTAGIRSGDMAVRLKYAGIANERITPLGDLDSGIDQFIQAVPEGRTAFILPTYTAMLRLRELLHQRGVVQMFWEQ
jgi:lipid II isoglutaminyl synthase (glutamine-hydrolysing)